MNQISIAQFAHCTMNAIASMVAQCFARDEVKVERFKAGATEGVIAFENEHISIVVIGPNGMGQWTGNLTQLCDRAEVWRAMADAATAHAVAYTNERDAAAKTADGQAVEG